MRLRAVLLAAGTSSRMGEINKLLLPFGGTTLLRFVYDNIVQSAIDEVVVVTGFESEKISKLFDGDNAKTTVLFNANFEKGMTSSIKAGVAVGSEVDAYMICLADMPFVTTKDYNKLISVFKENQAKKQCIIRPQTQQQQGNPIIFSSYYKETILNHNAPNGCKEILQKNQQNLIPVFFDNDLIFRDIDTIDCYNNINH